MKIIQIFILCLLFVSTTANSQFLKNSSIAVGLSTTQVLGNNPAGKPMVPSSEADPAISGGGFLGAQPGLDFRITIPIDKNQRWRLPFGVDYQFFSARERSPLQNIEIRITHSLNIVTPYLGLSYVLQDLQMIKTKTYLNLEARMSMINQIDYQVSYDYLNSTQFDTTFTPSTKGNATRFGGLLRVGVESYLFHPLQINASAGVSILNLLGRDDTRYELLTPTTFMEVKESFIWNLNFSIMFQYTF